MDRLVQLQVQERFPFEDLTLENAGLLALILSNEQLRTDSHASAERVSVVYRTAHPAINRAAAEVRALDYARRDALDAGIATYEAISTLVRPATRNARSILTVGFHAARLATMEADAFVVSLDEAAQRFHDTRPHIAAVVAEVADRLGPQTADFAVYGAAIACQFELQSV